jgi:hypothetical protein
MRFNTVGDIALSRQVSARSRAGLAAFLGSVSRFSVATSSPLRSLAQEHRGPTLRSRLVHLRLGLVLVHHVQEFVERHLKRSPCTSSTLANSDERDVNRLGDGAVAFVTGAKSSTFGLR